jgi:hypothetical protein
MHYDFDQVSRMIHALRSLRIARESSATAFVSQLLRDARELRAIWADYPRVRYQPLDDHYVLLKYLSALNADLLDDLCSGHHAWRGIVAASWLASLRPQPRYEAPLRSAWDSTPAQNQWLVALALAQVQGRTWAGSAPLQSAMHALGRVLDSAVRPDFSFSPAPTAIEIERLEVKRQQVLDAYRAGGRFAARRVLASHRSGPG